MKKLTSVFGILVICLVWVIVASISNSPAIPDGDKIVNALVSVFQSKNFSKHVLSTAKITLEGILFGSVIGVFSGLLCSLINPLGKIVEAVIRLLRSIPAIALFPLILVLFGIGDISRIIVIFWTAMPPIFLSTIYGLNSVEKQVIEAASLQANKRQILMSVKVPLAVSEILNGIKIGIGTGFISTVTAEMLGASKGIGYMILWDTNSFKYPEVYAYIIIVVLLGFIFDTVLNIIIHIWNRRLFT